MDFFLNLQIYFTPKGLKDSREQKTPMGRLFWGENPQRPEVFGGFHVRPMIPLLPGFF